MSSRSLAEQRGEMYGFQKDFLWERSFTWPRSARRHPRFWNPLWERREGLDQDRFAHVELLGRFGPVDVAAFESLNNLWPCRVLGQWSRARWPAEVLALGPGTFHARLHPLGQLALFELCPGDRDVVHRLPDRRGGFDPGFLQRPDPAARGPERLKVCRTVDD